MVSEYSYVRFRWWDHVDLDKVLEEFSGFKTKKSVRGKVGTEVSLYSDQRDEIKVESDTLQALLSPVRAVLNQKEAKPFTVKDMELRKKVMKMYPRNRPTPFPWMFSLEPKFEKEKL